MKLAFSLKEKQNRLVIPITMTPEAARKFVMKSGRYKGNSLAFLSLDYLEWIVREHSNGTLEEAARTVLKYLNHLRDQTFPKALPDRTARSPVQQGPSGDFKKLLESTPKGLF